MSAMHCREDRDLPNIIIIDGLSSIIKDNNPSSGNDFNESGGDYNFSFQRDVYTSFNYNNDNNYIATGNQFHYDKFRREHDIRMASVLAHTTHAMEYIK